MNALNSKEALEGILYLINSNCSMRVKQCVLTTVYSGIFKSFGKGVQMYKGVVVRFADLISYF